jgi:chemotaxis protein histidine kinase CheA
MEVYDLLFLPGFSTRDQADDFSGRGVGMDVVRTALADIRGTVTIESEPGKGTSFTIRLPLTLSITKALSCINNQGRIAFPMDGVEDMLDVRLRIASRPMNRGKPAFSGATRCYPSGLSRNCYSSTVAWAVDGCMAVPG